MKTMSHILPFVYLVFFTVLLLPAAVNAQNWEPVYFSETARYAQDGQEIESFLYLYPFAVNADTTTGRFLPNLNAEAPCEAGSLVGCVNSNNCKVATMPFLQEFAVFLPDGVIEFQNPDTFKIRYYAQLGESWIFKTNEMGNPVMAEVTDKFEGTVLGQSDSIKVVSVDNGIVFHLSKHHGIVLWSETDVNYVLSSIPERNLGGSNLSNATVFDFNPGDVFVYLHMEEQGYDDGVEFYELGNKSIVRHDVMDVTELQDSLFISMQTTRYEAGYSNTNGYLTNESAADSFTHVLKIPLDDDCHIYRWPLGGPMPARISAQIQKQHHNLGFSGTPCGVLSGEPVECTESELLGGTFPTPYFTSLATGVFGNRTVLSSSMDFLNGPDLDPDISAEEALNHDVREFYEWKSLNRCGFQFSESPVYIEAGETLFSDDNSNFNSGVTEIYALGEGLGVVAYDHELFGLGKWCFNRTVMIGYQKVGEEAFGFMPDTLELLALSAGRIVTASPLKLYPNPASTTMRIDLPGVILTNATLHDMQGRLVLDAAINHSEPTLDVSSLPKGMYLLRARDSGGKIYVSKLVVE